MSETANILVPVDLSPASVLAVNHGVQLARRLGASLTLLHVVELPPQSKHPLEIRAARLQWEQAERMLPRLLSTEDWDDLNVKVELRTGAAVEEIASVAAELQASIIVMGKHGRGLWERWMVGSVSEATLRKAGSPILIVHGDAGPRPPERILFATDLGAPEDGGLRAALEFARGTQASLVLFHMVDASFTVMEGMAASAEDAAVEKARASLDGLATECASRQVHADVVVVEGASAATSILMAAEKSGADLIVIGIRKKGAIARAVLGSTAEKLIREAQIPVLAVPV
jgi:nucleotide-binding universal stress UspA family protein